MALNPRAPGGPRPTIDTVSERAPLLHTVAALLTAAQVRKQSEQRLLHSLGRFSSRREQSAAE